MKRIFLFILLLKSVFCFSQTQTDSIKVKTSFTLAGKRVTKISNDTSSSNNDSLELITKFAAKKLRSGGSSFDPASNQTITGNWSFTYGFKAGTPYSGAGIKVDNDNFRTIIGDYDGYSNGTAINVDDDGMFVQFLSNGIGNGSTWQINNDGSASFADAAVNIYSDGHIDIAEALDLYPDGHVSFDVGRIYTDGNGAITFPNAWITQSGDINGQTLGLAGAAIYYDGSSYFANGGFNVRPNGAAGGGSYDGDPNHPNWWIGQDGQTRIGNALLTYKKTDGEGTIIEQDFESIIANKSVIRADIDGTFSLGLVTVDDNPDNNTDGEDNIPHNYTNTPVLVFDGNTLQLGATAQIDNHTGIATFNSGQINMSDGQISAGSGFYSENYGVNVGASIQVRNGGDVFGDLWSVGNNAYFPNGVSGVTGLDNFEETYIESTYSLGADGVNFMSNAWDGYNLTSHLNYQGLHWDYTDGTYSYGDPNHGNISLSSTQLSLYSHTPNDDSRNRRGALGGDAVSGGIDNLETGGSTSWSLDHNSVGGVINDGVSESSYYIGMGGININNGTRDMFTVYGTGDTKMTSVGFWDNPNGDFMGDISYDDGRFIFHDANDGTTTYLDCTYGNGYVAIINSDLLMGAFKQLQPIGMSTTEINDVPYPNDGNIVYNSTLHTICFYNGTNWQKVSSTNMN